MTRLEARANGLLDADAALAMLAQHAVPGAERVGPGTHQHSRLLSVRGMPREVSVAVRCAPHGGVVVAIDVAAPDRPELHALAAIVRRWFDLDTDLAPIAEHFASDPVLGPLVRRRPGLRVTQHPELFEAAVMTVLGQQVSVAAGATFGGRLVAALGQLHPSGLRAFPAAATLAALDPEELRGRIGITNARARTLVAMSVSYAAGEGPLLGDDPAKNRQRLLGIPGIGPWTVGYLGIRALGEPDAFPSGDLILRRALGGVSAAEAEARAQRWRPWRSYAAAHLWAAARG